MACVPDRNRLDRSILEHIRDQEPGRIAIEVGDIECNYAALRDRASALAACLAAIGVLRGTVVAVCLPRSFDQVAALLACWWVGAAYLPLDCAWPDARLASLIEDAQCSAVVA